MKTITINFTKRLPDINKYSQLPAEYTDYGRFAITHNSKLWFAGISSSHPQDTKDGFYWAISGNTIFISPRGSTLNFPDIIGADIIEWLLMKLKISPNEVKILK